MNPGWLSRGKMCNRHANVRVKYAYISNAIAQMTQSPKADTIGFLHDVAVSGKRQSGLVFSEIVQRYITDYT